MDLQRYFNNFKPFLDNIKNANDPRCENLSLLHSQRLVARGETSALRNPYLWQSLLMVAHPNAGSSKEFSVKCLIYFREMQESDVHQFFGGANLPNFS
jgi:hypothetical protein